LLVKERAAKLLDTTCAEAREGAEVRTDAEQAAWLADKIVALGDYAKEAAEMLRRWPGATCHHEPWQGRCIHCDAPFKDGYAYKPKEKE
jgi:hypothetical protein